MLLVFYQDCGLFYAGHVQLKA